MRACVSAMLLLFVSAVAGAQTVGATTPLARAWQVTVVETVPLPPLRITDPSLRLVDDPTTGEPRVELTFVATNITDTEVATNLSVWVHEFADQGQSWLFDALTLTTTYARIGPGKQLRIRSPYRKEFDQRAGTWILLSLKSAHTGDGEWEQASPWKKSVAIMRGEAKPSLADVSYDDFMDLELTDRKAVFNYVPPESRTRLVRTHLERYVESRGHELTYDQRVLVEEVRAAITASSYIVPRNEDTERRLRDLERRAKLLFTNAEVVQLFMLDGRKIPSKR